MSLKYAYHVTFFKKIWTSYFKCFQLLRWIEITYSIVHFKTGSTQLNTASWYFRPTHTHTFPLHTHTFPLHAHGEALLVATVLAAVSLSLVYQALLVVSTRVGEVFTHGPLEEAFAPLTAVHAVVLSCGNTIQSISTHMHKHTYTSMSPCTQKRHPREKKTDCRL